MHEFDEDALATERELVVPLGMNEADVEAARALADATGREAHALLA